MLARFKDAPERQPGLPECFDEKVMHASLQIGATMIMASDGRCEGPAPFEGFSLSLTVADETEAERVFAALSDGGAVTMPLEKIFWAPKFGLVEGPFGRSRMGSGMLNPEA